MSFNGTNSKHFRGFRLNMLNKWQLLSKSNAANKKGLLRTFRGHPKHLLSPTVRNRTPFSLVNHAQIWTTRPQVRHLGWRSTTFKITSCQAHQKQRFSRYKSDLKLYCAKQQYQKNRHIYTIMFQHTPPAETLKPAPVSVSQWLRVLMSCSCLMVSDRLNCYKPHILGCDEWSAWWEGWQMNQSRSSLLVLSLCNEKDSQAPGNAWVSNLSTKQLSVHLSHCETSQLSHSDCVEGWVAVCMREQECSISVPMTLEKGGGGGGKLIRVKRTTSFLR